MDFLDGLNGVLWSNAVLYVLLATGVLFTVWSGFGQYRALTHGVAIVRGKYDRESASGALTHFQALTTALSATVGLGNIAGVAIAVSIGGPGAVFWMWVTGVIGMALKMTEVTQAMMFRDVSDPQNPRGGAMWVVTNGLASIKPSLAKYGRAVGVLFCVTLLISAVTGGNMFQAWNVADISFTYFGIPKMLSGIVVTVFVGLVIVGGIRRIGAVTERIVPFMCLVYVAGALFVIVTQIGRVPEVVALVFRSAFAPTDAAGAFLGGTAGFAFLKGMQRALFSNEAGQGSAPIAHSATRTAEPVREGIVAGLEPFIDTLVVCTMTALVILLSGVWNRAPVLRFDEAVVAQPSGAGAWTIADTRISSMDVEDTGDLLREGLPVFAVGQVDGTRARLFGKVGVKDGVTRIHWAPVAASSSVQVDPGGAHLELKGATLTARAFDRIHRGLGLWIVPAVAWLFAISTIISWSYYGEQGVRFLAGARLVMPYRIVYTALAFVASTPLIATENELDIVSTFGTGVMLWVNIPIMLLFGGPAMRAYHAYFRDLKG